MAYTSDAVIQIRGARTHNLKNVDLDIPRGKLTVLTGVSGSGKSSLAFDTLFAEGQRQYLQSLSSYTRQFVDQMERPLVDSIRGLQPSLCIDQHQGSTSPRSTVGTVTEIYDYLRLLMARVGTPTCHACGRPIDRQDPSAIIASICREPLGTRLTVLAPMVIGRKGGHADIWDRLTKAGLLRAYVDGAMVDLESPPVLSPRREHDISAVVDRVIVREENRERVEQAVRSALELSDGLVSTQAQFADADAVRERLYSTRYACTACGISLPEIEPRMFSFNSAYGACPTCEGYGYLEDDPDRTCSECNGDRLRVESLAIRIQARSIADISRLPVHKARRWLEDLEFEGDARQVASPILKEIQPRLEFLERVGLGYLTLARSADSLSGGELQRVRLATSVGTGLIGVCYVLDEPSVGLHPRDTERLIAILRSLQQQGNTVVVVEHDDLMMRAADLLVDIGPGAGREGGCVVACGPPARVERVAESVTGQYLLGSLQIAEARRRPVGPNDPYLEIHGITKNNLQDVDVRVPLERLVGVTGVSGSGKSTLVHDTLVRAVDSNIRDVPATKHWKRVRGVDSLERLIEVDQTPIGRSPRSVPATYCGLWDDVRKVFAATRDAKQRGFSASRFSFNSGAGRCEVCAGQGRQKLEMSFLEDVDIPCAACGGQRFNRATLAVHFKGKNIAQVLAMTVEEGVEFFENHASIRNNLERLQQVGLGYLTLGQSATTLSGGEAQRLKLATELARSGREKTLLVLDEPTTGLHHSDVAKLLVVLQDLVDRGQSVLVIEHHMDLIKNCDWVIDMGPEGGEEGGKILQCGPPDIIARSETPTGIALRNVIHVAGKK